MRGQASPMRAQGEENEPEDAGPAVMKDPQDQFMDVVDKAQSVIPPEKYAKKVRAAGSCPAGLLAVGAGTR